MPSQVPNLCGCVAKTIDEFLFVQLMFNPLTSKCTCIVYKNSQPHEKHRVASLKIRYYYYYYYFGEIITRCLENQKKRALWGNAQYIDINSDGKFYFTAMLKK
jgi:hypothetical protein